MFTPNSTSEICRNVTLSPDDVIENPENFTLMLLESDSAVSVPMATATVVILDSTGRYS